jgi:hypothetical protein
MFLLVLAVTAYGGAKKPTGLTAAKQRSTPSVVAGTIKARLTRAGYTILLNGNPTWPQTVVSAMTPR